MVDCRMAACFLNRPAGHQSGDRGAAARALLDRADAGPDWRVASAARGAPQQNAGSERILRPFRLYAAYGFAKPVRGYFWFASDGIWFLGDLSAGRGTDCQ